MSNLTAHGANQPLPDSPEANLVSSPRPQSRQAAWAIRQPRSQHKPKNEGYEMTASTTPVNDHPMLASVPIHKRAQDQWYGLSSNHWISTTRQRPSFSESIPLRTIQDPHYQQHHPRVDTVGDTPSGETSLIVKHAGGGNCHSLPSDDLENQ